MISGLRVLRDRSRTKPRKTSCLRLRRVRAQGQCRRNAGVNILNRENTPGVEPSRQAGSEAQIVQTAQSAWNTLSFRPGKRSKPG